MPLVPVQATHQNLCTPFSKHLGVKQKAPVWGVLGCLVAVWPFPVPPPTGAKLPLVQQPVGAAAKHLGVAKIRPFPHIAKKSYQPCTQYTPHRSAVAAVFSALCGVSAVSVARLPTETKKAPNRGCFVLFLVKIATVLCYWAVAVICRFAHCYLLPLRWLLVGSRVCVLGCCICMVLPRCGGSQSNQVQVSGWYFLAVFG